LYYLPTIPTPAYILLLVLISIISFNVLAFEKMNIQMTPTIGNVVSVKQGNFIKFLQNSLSSIISSVLKSNTSLERNEYLSILYSLFVFIFICNVFGLMPYTFTLTSSFIVTLFLAATHFIGINIIGWYKQS